MDTKQLSIFLTVAQTLNFTRAAQEHYMTQPAVSHQISELERELGAKLFIRTSHRVELTTAGEAFKTHATGMLTAAQQAKSHVYDLCHGKTGHLKILVVQPSVDVVSACVSSFFRRYPDIRVDVEVVTGAAQMRAINNDEADVYLTFASLLRNYPQMDFVQLKREPFVLLLPRSYDGPVDVDDLSALARMPLVCENMAEAPFLVGQVFEICKNRNLNPQNIHWCNSAQSLLIAVRSGLGFALVSSASCVPADGGDLRAIPLAGEDAWADHSMGWRRNTANQATAFFLSAAQELF